jgi:hypothetical protein
MDIMQRITRGAGLGSEKNKNKRGAKNSQELILAQAITK